MDMEHLFERLRTEIRRRIAEGDFNQRGLSRMTAISQSHVSNVLNGTKILTPMMADRFMRILNLDVLDLMPECCVAPRKLPGSEPACSQRVARHPLSRDTSR
jgi:hypothetical protein